MAKPGTLKIDHHVVSADGTRYSVRYVHAPSAAAGMPIEVADLARIDADGSWTDAANSAERITLPTSELRRVAALRLPPIQGLPTARPCCVSCGTRLAPATRYEWGPLRNQVIARTFTRWEGYWADRADDTAKFCTMRCALSFARATYKAGYRLTRKPAPAAARKGAR